MPRPDGVKMLLKSPGNSAYLVFSKQCHFLTVEKIPQCEVEIHPNRGLVNRETYDKCSPLIDFTLNLNTDSVAIEYTLSRRKTQPHPSVLGSKEWIK